MNNNWQQRDNSPTQQLRKKTKYVVDKNIPNMVEVHKIIHDKNMNAEIGLKRHEELYKIDHEKREMLEAKQMQKLEETMKEEEKNNTFQPQLNKHSKKIMENREEDIIQRNQEWIEQRDEKRRQNLFDFTEFKKQKELEATAKLEFKKADYGVESKVKQRIEREKLKRSLSPLYKTGKSDYLKNK